MAPARFRAGAGEQGHEQGDTGLVSLLRGRNWDSDLRRPQWSHLLHACGLQTSVPGHEASRPQPSAPDGLHLPTPAYYPSPFRSVTEQGQHGNGSQVSVRQRTAIVFTTHNPSPWAPGTTSPCPLGTNMSTSTLGRNSGTSTLGIYAHSAWRTQCPSTSDVCPACSRTSRLMLGE